MEDLEELFEAAQDRDGCGPPAPWWMSSFTTIPYQYQILAMAVLQFCCFEVMFHFAIECFCGPNQHQNISKLPFVACPFFFADVFGSVPRTRPAARRAERWSWRTIRSWESWRWSSAQPSILRLSWAERQGTFCWNILVLNAWEWGLLGGYDNFQSHGSFPQSLPLAPGKGGFFWNWPMEVFRMV